MLYSCQVGLGDFIDSAKYINVLFPQSIDDSAAGIDILSSLKNPHVPHGCSSCTLQEEPLGPPAASIAVEHF